MKKITIAVILLFGMGLWAQEPGNAAPTPQKVSPPAPPQTSQATDSIPVIPGVTVQEPNMSRDEARIAREVRHELLMIPYYTLFDDLRYRVHGDTVELLGEVVDPVIKGQAESAVKKIEGVQHVINHIEQLPPSPMDTRLRSQLARAIFGFDGLSRYGWEAAPSIHIIVKNGHVRLTGVVASQADKNMAGIQARTVPNVFDVKNELVVSKGSV